MQTFVIGHKNPDMDAIVSAIAYAHFKREQGMENVLPARAGATNERIDFVLETFRVETPVFLSDVSPRVEDVMGRNLVTARAGSPVYVAMTRLGEKGYRAMPVVDGEGRCLGLITGFRLGRHMCPPPDELGRMREVEVSLSGLVETLQAKVVAGEVDDVTESLQFVVAAMYTPTFLKRIAKLDTKRIVLLVGDRWNIQQNAIKRGVRAIVVTGGLPVRRDTVAMAKKAGVPILSSPYDTATTMLLVRGAVNAEKLMEPEFRSFPPEMPLKEVRREVANAAEFIFPVLDAENRLVGVFSKSDFLKPVRRQLILVDHNEMSQAVKGADEVPIVEILDHHRIGSISTDAPIFFINQPVGSTSTIVANCYRQAGITIPKSIAGILMAGLISDTLNLTSPTATAVDAEVMNYLSRRAGWKPARLAEKIFSVGSPLLTMKPEQAVTADCKEYEAHGRRFSLAQIEELSFVHFAEKRETLLEALEKYRVASGLSFSALLVTDVISRDSIFLVQGDETFQKAIDYPEEAPHTWRMSGVVSRKKQLLPYVLGLLEKLV